VLGARHLLRACHVLDTCYALGASRIFAHAPDGGGLRRRSAQRITEPTAWHQRPTTRQGAGDRARRVGSRVEQ
jgi:hypothetical protein